MAESPRGQSEFNMAISFLNRLNACFYAIDEAKMSLDVYTWFRGLDALFCELSNQMKDDERAEFLRRLDGLNNLMPHAQSAQLRGRGVQSETVRQLRLFELDLRRVLKEAGLETKMINDPRFSMA